MNCFVFLRRALAATFQTQRTMTWRWRSMKWFLFDDDEHPNAWLRYGSDGGQMFVLDVYQGGRIIFTHWADTDYEAELAPPGQLEHTSRQSVLRLWQALQRGDMKSICVEAWLRAV